MYIERPVELREEFVTSRVAFWHQATYGDEKSRKRRPKVVDMCSAAGACQHEPCVRLVQQALVSWAALAGIEYAFPAALGEAGHLSPTRQRKEPPAKRLTGGLIRSLAQRRRNQRRRAVGTREVFGGARTGCSGRCKLRLRADRKCLQRCAVIK